MLCTPTNHVTLCLGLITVFPCLMAVLMSMWSCADTMVAFFGMYLVKRWSMELFGPKLIQAEAGLMRFGFSGSRSARVLAACFIFLFLFRFLF